MPNTGEVIRIPSWLANHAAKIAHEEHRRTNDVVMQILQVGLEHFEAERVKAAHEKRAIASLRAIA